MQTCKHFNDQLPTVAVFVHNDNADRRRGTATESDERKNGEINLFV